MTEPIQCPVCNKCFKTEQARDQHFQAKHVRECFAEIRRLQSELAEQRKEIDGLKKLNEEYLGMIKETEKQEKNNDRRH